MSSLAMDPGRWFWPRGKGVAGDLAGFVASIYLRGVRFVQLPTTLLAMADSRVGRKTGINIPVGKNLVGTLSQPEAVFTDTDSLATSEPRDWCPGVTEVVKMAVTRDKAFFKELEALPDLSPGGNGHQGRRGPLLPPESPGGRGR